MRLIDRDRSVATAGLAAPLEPGRIAPFVSRDRPNHRRRRRRVLRAKPHRIGLLRHQGAVRGLDLVFVVGTLGHARKKHFPNPRRTALSHRMALTIPVVEVADHRHPPRVRCPHREMHPGNVVDVHRMRAQRLPQPQVGAFAEQVLVDLAEHRSEPKRVLLLPRRVGVPQAQPVSPWRRPQVCHPDAFVACRLECNGFAGPALWHQRRRVNTRSIDPHHPAFRADLMRAQVAERVTMVPRGKGGILCRIGQRHGHGSLRTPVPRPRHPGRTRGLSGPTKTSPFAPCSRRRCAATRRARPTARRSPAEHPNTR